MQRMVGFDSSAAGFILANAIHQSPAILRGADFVRLGIECEIAVQPTPQFLGYRFWDSIPNVLIVFSCTHTSLICICNSLIRPSSTGRWCDH